MSMNIGGYDLVFSVPDHPGLQEVALRFFEALWPRCVIESDQSGDVDIRSDFSARTVAASEGEFYIYRDRKAADSWSSGGQQDDNWNQMFHLVLGPRMSPDSGEREITVVIDELTEEAKLTVAQLRANLFDAYVWSPVPEAIAA